jgi:phosphatidylserine/phosphatidylglycerophosphate/cardiolipin synthase-like enzyme
MNGIRIGVKNIPIWVFILIASLLCTVVVLALASFGTIQLVYRVVPSQAEQKYIYVLVDRDYYYSILNDLRSANNCVYIAMYSMIYDPDDTFDWANDLIRELVNAKQRGVNVSVVIEYRTYYGYIDDNLPAYNYLHSNGVNVKLDNETDTDHLKLVVIDNKIVYVGSHNWSESALYYNHETSVKIISEEIAQSFIEYLKNNYGF